MKLLIPLTIVGFAMAATPVASVSSASNFELSGAGVVAAGVPSWPLMVGDTVVAGTSAARIRFVDGTVVTLGPRSKVAVQEKSNDLSLRLVNGFMMFTLGPASSMSVYSGNTLVPAQPGVTKSAATAPTGASATNILTGPAPGAPPSLSQH